MSKYRLIAPINAHIELTDLCNLNCFHCYNYWRQDSQYIIGNSLSEENILLILK